MAHCGVGSMPIRMSTSKYNQFEISKIIILIISNSF